MPTSASPTRRTWPSADAAGRAWPRSPRSRRCWPDWTSGTPSAASASGGSSAHVAAAAVGLKTAKIGGATVLTNVKGFAVYSFAPDTMTRSDCTGACAAAWPPVKGPATAGVGLTGKLGTIKRPDGSTQATYNGQPLYTFIKDTGPGTDKGNGVNAFGGLWHQARSQARSWPPRPAGRRATRPVPRGAARLTADPGGVALRVARAQAEEAQVHVAGGHRGVHGPDGLSVGRSRGPDQHRAPVGQQRVPGRRHAIARSRRQSFASGS